MTDEDIIAELKLEASHASAIEVAEKLGKMVPGGLSRSVFITYFKRAFPQIPLRILIDASGWHRISSFTVTDAEFIALLQEWIGRKSP